MTDESEPTWKLHNGSRVGKTVLRETVARIRDVMAFEPPNLCFAALVCKARCPDFRIPRPISDQLHEVGICDVRGEVSSDVQAILESGMIEENLVTGFRWPAVYGLNED